MYSLKASVSFRMDCLYRIVQYRLHTRLTINISPTIPKNVNIKFIVSTFIYLNGWEVNKMNKLKTPKIAEPKQIVTATQGIIEILAMRATITPMITVITSVARLFWSPYFTCKILSYIERHAEIMVTIGRPI